MLNSDVLTVLVIVIVAFAVIRWLERKMGHRFGEPDLFHYEIKMADYETKITALQLEMDEQRLRYEVRIRDLEHRVDFLVEQLLRAGIQIRDMEKAIAMPKTTTPVEVEKELLGKPLVLVCGDDPAVIELDRQALRRTGILYQRIMPATKKKVEEDFRRRRQDQTLYRWVHVSAHANEEGVELADGIAEPSWWNGNLDGIEVVFLAACKTGAVADALAGLVTVVFVLEDIESQDAADFTYAFWKRMKEHGNPTRAFRQATTEVPQVAEFTDIRTR